MKPKLSWDDIASKDHVLENTKHGVVSEVMQNEDVVDISYTVLYVYICSQGTGWWGNACLGWNRILKLMLKMTAQLRN